MAANDRETLYRFEKEEGKSVVIKRKGTKGKIILKRDQEKIPKKR
jgi:chitinase